MAKPKPVVVKTICSECGLEELGGADIMTKEEQHQRAADFINQIVGINRKHGMATVTSGDVYENAVASTARAFRRLVKP